MASEKILGNEHLNSLIEASPLAIIAMDREGKVTKWNPVAEKIFGWEETEVLGVSNPILPEGNSELYNQMRQRLLSGQSIRGEELFRKSKDGQLITVRASSALMKDKKGNVIGVVAIYENISEKKKTEEQLVWNELLLREMTESSGLAYYVADHKNDTALYFNSRFCDLWNISLDEALLKNRLIKNSNVMTLCLHSLDSPSDFQNLLDSVSGTNNTSRIETELKFKDGRTIGFFTTVINSSKGEYLGRLYLFEDVTERKLYESLLSSEAEYKKLVENSPEPILLTDIIGKIISANKSAVKVFGISAEKICSLSLEELFGITKFPELTSLSAGMTVSVERKFKHDDKKEIVLELSARLYSKNRVQIIARDITASKKQKESVSIFTEAQDSFIFASDALKKINFEITRLSNFDFDVLLIGETGVGKDLVAAEIYRRSNRKDKPFICVPIGTLSETLIESELFGHEKGAFSGADKTTIGKFEAANGGILYIPEISSLPEAVQLKLLYFMQYKAISRVGMDARKGEIKLDVRLIMATNENLQELVDKGRIRKDFYYRISGSKIFIPPLRERKEDIEVLANYFADLNSQNLYQLPSKFSAEAIEMFKKSEWHGNVRELSGCIRNLISLHNERTLTAEHLQFARPTSFDKSYEAQDESLASYEKAETDFRRNYFQKLLESVNWKVSEAAKLAGLTPQGLRKLLNKLNISSSK